MNAKLFCKFGRLKGLTFEIGEETVVGRSKQSGVQLPHHAVSSRHARIFREPDGSGYAIEDLGSLNGTWLDGARLAQSQRLDDLHVINFGGVADFFFQDLSSVESAGPAASSARSKTLISRDVNPMPAHLRGDLPTVPVDVDLDAPKSDAKSTHVGRLPGTMPANLISKLRSGMGAAESKPVKKRFRLEVELAQGVEVYDLAEGENLVGRDAEAGLCIPSHEISRRHAVLAVRNGAVFLRDEGSLNHTFLNRVQIEREAPVKPGDILHFSKIEARLIADDGAGDQRSEP